MTTDTELDHSHHSAELHAEMMSMHDLSASEVPGDNHQSSCSDCAFSCTSAVLMISPSELLPEQLHTERILSFTPFVPPLTSSGLERPPRFFG